MMKATIILSAYEHKGNFLPALYATCFQSAPPDEYEVIIIDNHWIEKEDLYGLHLLQKFFTHLRLLKEPQRNFAQLFNHAAQQARGAYLLFLESHCLPPYHWVDSWLSYARTTGHKAACGEIVEIPSDNRTAQHEAVMNNRSWEHLRKMHEGTYHADFHNACIRRDYFLQKGMFDETLAYISGFEFAARLHRNGEHMRLAKEIVVGHKCHIHIEKYCEAIYNQGHSKTVLYHNKGKAFTLPYFPMKKFPKHYSLIRALRLPLLVTITLLYHVLLRAYALTLAFNQRRMAEYLFMQAVIQAHRRGQLTALAGQTPARHKRTAGE